MLPSHHHLWTGILSLSLRSCNSLFEMLENDRDGHKKSVEKGSCEQLRVQLWNEHAHTQTLSHLQRTTQNAKWEFLVHRCMPRLLHEEQQCTVVKRRPIICHGEEQTSENGELLRQHTHLTMKNHDRHCKHLYRLTSCRCSQRHS